MLILICALKYKIINYVTQLNLMKHLKQLIKSMTKRERFYFNKTFLAEKKSNFFLLYELLSKNPEIDISQLKGHFKDSTIGRNIHYEINHLYSKILRVLNIYRMNRPTPNLLILQTLRYVEILIEKKQLTQAKKLVAKAKKKAYKFEEFSILMKIIEMEEKLNFTGIDADIVKNIQKLEAERKSAALKIRNYNQLKLLKNRFVGFQFSEGLYTNSPEKYPLLFNNSILKNREYIRSKKSLDLWLFCKSMAFSLLGQYENAKQKREERLLLLRENKELFSDEEEIFALNNYLFLMIQMKDQSNFNIKHDLLLSLMNSKNTSKTIILFFSYYLQLALFTTLEEKDKITQLFPIAFDFLTKSIDKLNPTQNHYLFFYLTTSMLTIDNYEKSLEVLVVWNQHRIEETRFATFKILWMITHYSLGNLRFLQNEIINIKRAIRDKNINHDNLNLVVRFFDNVIKEEKNTVEYLKELESQFKKNNEYLPSSYVMVHEINLGVWAKNYRLKLNHT